MNRHAGGAKYRCAVVLRAGTLVAALIGLAPISAIAQAPAPVPAAREEAAQGARPSAGAPASTPAQATTTPLQRPAYQSQVTQAQPQPPAAPAQPALPPLPGQGASRQAMEDLIPVTPGEVRDFRRRVDDLQRAATQPPGAAPKPVSSSITITQAPGETPPLVRLAQGHVSSVVFTDSTGAPWPIAFAVPGDTSRLQVTIPVSASPTLEINQLSSYPYGNISVTLQNNPIPVSLSVISGAKEVDTRLDVRVLKRGPAATTPIINRPLPEVASRLIGAILDGVPPSEAKYLKSSSAAVNAWRVAGKMFVRTKLTLLSPAWVESGTSADGMNAYEVPDTPVLLLSMEGRPISVSIGE